jgi:hypothetical protein
VTELLPCTFIRWSIKMVLYQAGWGERHIISDRIKATTHKTVHSPTSWVGLSSRAFPESSILYWAIYVACV